MLKTSINKYYRRFFYESGNALGYEGDTVWQKDALTVFVFFAIVRR